MVSYNGKIEIRWNVNIAMFIFYYCEIVRESKHPISLSRLCKAAIFFALGRPISKYTPDNNNNMQGNNCKAIIGYSPLFSFITW